MLQYDYRVQAMLHYNPLRVYDPPSEPSLMRFSRVVWHGYDEGGAAVYKADPLSGDVVRIDFIG